MKNILQLFKKMKPKSYYGAGVAVKASEDRAYTSNTAFSLSGCTVDETTDCRNIYSTPKYENIYSTPKYDMPVQGIGLIKARNIR